jgi:hypothetical protein
MSLSMESTAVKVQQDGASPTVAWWRLPIVWMVIGGPALVVVASFVTLALALIYPDPVLATAPNASKTDMPAVQGRNHAATPSR